MVLSNPFGQRTAAFAGGYALGVFSSALDPSSGGGSSFTASVDSTGRTHILDGDATGGGHGAGRGISGKSEFPSTWSDDEVINQIIDVANDSTSNSVTQSNGRIKLTGTRNGIDITVIVDPSNNHRIITGFPTNVPRNP